VKRLIGETQPMPKAVILDAGANHDLDITSAEVVEELAMMLHAAGLDLALAATGRHP
jgi:hypothetical protein